MAQELADHGYRFVDLDDEISRDAGRSIQEIFTYEGEPAFRERETRLLAELIREARTTPLVIATGGKSIPKIGATGFGYTIAEQFGLKIVPTRPALVPGGR